MIVKNMFGLGFVVIMANLIAWGSIIAGMVFALVGAGRSLYWNQLSLGFGSVKLGLLLIVVGFALMQVLVEPLDIMYRERKDREP